MRFAKAVYVLHCFEKKSPSGIRTASTTIEIFLSQFPSVSREMVVAVLEQAREALVHDAHPA